jgi:hypothetical protein
MNCDCNEEFSPKDPEERVILTFNFARTLAVGEQLTGVEFVQVHALAGEDAAPGNILDGPAAVDLLGKAVRLAVDRGSPGVTYRILVKATTTAGQRFVCAGNLAVQPA